LNSRGRYIFQGDIGWNKNVRQTARGGLYKGGFHCGDRKVTFFCPLEYIWTLEVFPTAEISKPFQRHIWSIYQSAILSRYDVSIMCHHPHNIHHHLVVGFPPKTLTPWMHYHRPKISRGGSAGTAARVALLADLSSRSINVATEGVTTFHRAKFK
jgi:hypothetical protein